MNWSTELQRASHAATKAATLLMTSFASDAGIDHARGHDIKTRADVAAEACIKECLAPSNIPMLAEETCGECDADTTGLHWLVDPLDGTMNFVRGLPVCAVSVALWEGNRPILGAVYDL
ncbi:MAG: inositol monophosphatase, partial [Verrucomicrobia bacterium]|nr:inositol monophosphatase [Verrucomicrobiota bacterium]